MPTIQLDASNRIAGAEYAWQLERLHVADGKQRWRPYAYFPTFTAALSEAVRREIRTAPADGVAETIAAAERVHAKYERLLAELFDGAGIVDKAKRLHRTMRVVK